MTNTELIRYWNAFGDVPINDNDQIMIPFMGFLPGTDRFEIWHWFDEQYSRGVAKLIEDCEVFECIERDGYWIGRSKYTEVKILADDVTGPYYIYVRSNPRHFWHLLVHFDSFNQVLYWMQINCVCPL